MNRILSIALILAFLIHCSYGQQKKSGKGGSGFIHSTEIKPYLEMITEGELRAGLHFLAADHFEGRGTGTPGGNAAASYLASSYAMMGIPPVNTADPERPLENYFQVFPFESRALKGVSQNVFAFIEGSDPVLKEEIIVLSAHYDHLGKNTALEGDQIFNGAADDGSGTVALLEIAESFIAASNRGTGPRRSILFAHFSGEEIGLQGSLYYTTQFPVLPLERIVCDINMDGVGGIDPKNPTGSNNYVYILQVDSTSAHLRRKASEVNTALSINLNLARPANADRFRSDNNSFELMLVPAIYFSTGLTEHYHQVSDEPSTINYAHMTKIVKLVFALTWDLSQADAVKSTFRRNDYELTGKYSCPPCGCEKDNTPFDSPGICAPCHMALIPHWRKRL